MRNGRTVRKLIAGSGGRRKREDGVEVEVGDGGSDRRNKNIWSAEEKT